MLAQDHRGFFGFDKVLHCGAGPQNFQGFPLAQVAWGQNFSRFCTVAQSAAWCK